MKMISFTFKDKVDVSSISSASFLYGPTSYCCIGKLSVFIVSITQNTKIHCVGNCRAIILNLAVYVMTTRF